jgi:hypothetical protein
MGRAGVEAYNPDPSVLHKTPLFPHKEHIIMATLTLDQRIAAAAEVYKSGQSDSRKALANVKRLIKQKVLSVELALMLTTEEEAVCP